MKKLKWRFTLESAVNGNYYEYRAGKFVISRLINSKGRFLLESGLTDVGMFKTLSRAKKVAQLISNG